MILLKRFCFKKILRQIISILRNKNNRLNNLDFTLMTFMKIIYKYKSLENEIKVLKILLEINKIVQKMTQCSRNSVKK